MDYLRDYRCHCQTPKSPMPGHRGLFSRSRPNRDSRFPESRIPAKSGCPISRIPDSYRENPGFFPGQIGPGAGIRGFRGLAASDHLRSGVLCIQFRQARGGIPLVATSVRTCMPGQRTFASRTGVLVLAYTAFYFDLRGSQATIEAGWRQSRWRQTPGARACPRRTKPAPISSAQFRPSVRKRTKVARELRNQAPSSLAAQPILRRASRCHRPRRGLLERRRLPAQNCREEAGGHDAEAEAKACSNVFWVFVSRAAEKCDFPPSYG